MSFSCPALTDCPNQEQHQTPRAPLPPLGSCSLDAGENLAGTAAQKQTWLLLENPGAWGRDILDGSVFGPELSADLAQLLEGLGARLLLIRKPGRRDASTAPQRLRVFLAETGGQDFTPARLWAFEVAVAQDLLTLPLGQPEQIPGARLSDQPLFLVCAHSKRDLCCAVRGRPIAAFLDQRAEGVDVWECSHTGGHRFAPVALSLPTGYTYGRLNFVSALAAAQASAAGQVALEGLRGRASHAPVEQVAELAVRQQLAVAGESPGPDDLSPQLMEATEPGLFAAHVAHRDGRAWLVTARTHPTEARPASCGAVSQPGKSWELVSLVAL